MKLRWNHLSNCERDVDVHYEPLTDELTMTQNFEVVLLNKHMREKLIEKIHEIDTKPQPKIRAVGD